MGSKELNETLGVLNRHNGDQPSVSGASYLRTLKQLEEINRNLKKALYGDADKQTDKKSS